MPYVVALRPPGNIAKEVADLQRTVQREYGLVSAVALPPVTILAQTQQPPERSFLEDTSVGAFTALRPQRIRLSTAALELALEPHSPLLDAVASFFGTDDFRPGFFLGDTREARGITEEDIATLPVPAFTLRSAWLSIFELRFSNPDTWWEDLVWIERWRSRTLRMRG